jgi:hypothetical protein
MTKYRSLADGAKAAQAQIADGRGPVGMKLALDLVRAIGRIPLPLAEMGMV